MSDTAAGARDHHAMAYDAERGTTITFGGGPFPRRPGPWATDTWAWDGSVWTRAASDGPRRVARSRPWRTMALGDRSCCSAVSECLSASNASQPSFGDTWVWEGSSWRKATDDGPRARNRHAMTFDSHAGVVLLYGGGADGMQFADMWKWDGRRWTEIHLTGPTPGPRELHSMAYECRAPSHRLVRWHQPRPGVGRHVGVGRQQVAPGEVGGCGHVCSGLRAHGSHIEYHRSSRRGASLAGWCRHIRAHVPRRHFLYATGMTRTTYRRIEQARYAVNLLRCGVSIADTIHDAGYFDRRTSRVRFTISLGRRRRGSQDRQLSFL